VKQQVVLPKATAESFYSCAFKPTKQVLTRRHESFGVNTRQVRPPLSLRHEMASLHHPQPVETHNKRITGCRVTGIAPSHKYRHGTGFQVHIWLTIPKHRCEQFSV
jgi:hypothetical protein